MTNTIQALAERYSNGNKALAEALVAAVENETLKGWLDWRGNLSEKGNAAVDVISERVWTDARK